MAQSGFSMVIDGHWFNIVGEVGDLLTFADLAKDGNRILVSLIMPKDSYDELQWTEGSNESGETVLSDHDGSARQLRERLQSMMHEGWVPQNI